MEGYKSYSDSGIQWLGQMPSHWTKKRLKSVFSRRSESYNPDENLQVLSLLKDVGVIPYSEKGNIGNKSKEDVSSYNIARKGDIVMNSMNVIIGSVDITPYDGYISPAYYALYSDSSIVTKYFNYLFHLKAVQKQMRCLASGILEIRLRLSSTKLFGMYFPFPPLSEQEKIVKYLEDEIQKIDSFKNQKENEIQVLNELKDAILADVINHGLNDNASLKASGIFWQPQIPENWHVSRMKHVLVKLDRARRPDDELLVCSNSGEVKMRGDSKMGLVSDSDDIYQGVRAGDLLIHGMDTWHGAIAVSQYDGMCTPVVHVCDSSQNKHYIAMYLRNMANQKIFKLISNGVRQNTSDFRSWNKVANIPIPLPPIEEQDAIVKFVDSKTKAIDSMVSSISAEIELLAEYKQRLIADVVTGRINVQNIE